ncbi:thioredoxin domain-containing protein [Streptomyces sp. P9(2023)]|uniref:DsbA family protein n=1 Tax=Streptomyces sp. P9(2023) TaxID=3064394 RepID=UPI0028F41929|nr:thioredoxin domain-containing protein [Streptomyces sp. P9(2023)]MDT9687405.1 thioredoxin domain-containing protein [Streptomyces sp. P9(2023)]
MTKLKKNLLAAGVLLAALAVAFGSFMLFSPKDTSSVSVSAEPAADAKPVRDDSHRLTSPARSELTVVEFLDFECEGCGAAHPIVEKLRAEYKDRVTFVARYFPMPGHRNSTTAALAVEAAAQQGKFEPMYSKLFGTQKEWGEAQDSKAGLFRTFAEGLGLDMTKYDAVVKAPATLERVKADQKDGLGLGVQGTPTFFVDGVKIQTPRSYEEFKALIDSRLAR